MELQIWKSLVLKAGIALLLVISFCEAGSKQSRRTPAHKLAQQTGAAHYEERYEKIIPEDKKLHRIRKRASDEDIDYEVYQGVVGRPGIDFPILPRIPQTTFSCRTFGNGYFADLETDCQVFHICEEGRKISFLCPNGTIFQQAELTCDWWFKVNCAGSPGHYAESSEMLSRAQNRAKQRGQSSKNEFHSSERDYSRERLPSGHKNQYPVKSGKVNNGNGRTRSQHSGTRRYDSDEVPSVESLDFEDFSGNSASLEHGSSGSNNNGGSYERKGNGQQRHKSNKGSFERNEKIVTKNDRNDAAGEMQEVAESGSILGNRNGNNNRNNDISSKGYEYSNTKQNGYVYENPNKNRKNENRDGRQRTNNGRGRHRYDGQGGNRSSDSSDESLPNQENKQKESKPTQPPKQNESKEEKTSTPPSLIHKRVTTSAPVNLVTEISNRNNGNGKTEASKPTAFYTPTIPTVPRIKNTAGQLPKATSERYSLDTTTTTKKPFSGNLGFSFGQTTDPNSSETTTLLPSTARSLVIGLRKTHHDDPAIKNNVLPDRKSTFNNIDNKASQRVGGRTFATTTNYPETTTSFTRGRTFIPKLTTTEDTSITTSTSGPTYLPRDSTTVSPSSSGPTYLPKETTTFRPSSSGPTYLPTTTSGPTYLPTPSTRSPKTQDPSVAEHVKDMIRTLNDLKYDLKVDTNTLNQDADKYLGKSPRPGLEIPPSSGPATLVSLASYFAGEDSENKTSLIRSAMESVNVKSDADINSGNLSNKTVKNYENLFGIAKTTEPTYLPDILSPEFKVSDSNDLEAQHSSGILGDAIGKPETRKIAQVFTNALSAYLEDPDSFRQVLSEVRPTEPTIEIAASGAPAVYRKPVTLKPEFDRGTGATYLPKPTTTNSPPTAGTEDLEVLDFSDVTSKNKNKGGKLRTTTNYPTATVASTFIASRPVSRFSIGSGTSREDFVRSKTTTTTETNDIAAEINKELDSSTIKPLSLSFDLVAPEFDTVSTTREPDSSTTLSFDLLPPVGGTGKSFIPSLSAELLPPGDDDDDMLQRAQSQSFVASRNQLTKELKADRNGKAKSNLQSEPLINGSNRNRFNVRTTTAKPSEVKTTENPWQKLTQSVYLDPLTINDALMMDQLRTTTASPFTYLPKSTLPTTTEKNPIHINLNTKLNDSKDFEPAVISRTSKTLINYPGLVDELLPPEDGMQKIAVRMFGGLNETDAGHLMNVMKKAESNQMVRRLILLLIQTCDEDYSKTVEQSRKALLNALIGMDNEYSFDDEVEIIKLKPRRQKSINSLNRSGNLIELTTSKIPVTTYRRSLDLLKLTTSTTIKTPTTTTDSNLYTTTTTIRPEDTTRFEIRVEDPDEYSTSTINYDTRTSTTIQPDTTTLFTTVEYPTTTIRPNVLFRIQEGPTIPTDSSKIGLKRKAKDLEGSFGNVNSHRNSDERALELLKSLYSLASKFGKR